MNQRIPDTHTVGIQTRGAEICVRRHGGDGPPLVLIHGIGSSSADFDPVLPQLSALTSPITLDLRGHGESSRPAEGYHYGDYIHDLEDVLAALSLARPIVLGHSLGGIITLFWASQHAGEARGIIIEDAPLRSGEEFAPAFDGWLTLNGLPQDAVRAWYASKNPTWSDAVLDQRSLDMVHTERRAIEELRDASLANVGLDTTADLAQIADPLLYLHGDVEYGSMAHPEDISAMKRMIPQAEIVRVPGAGHTIHRSHPDAWLESVKSFVERLDD